jgi:hypothetical protein
MIVCADVAAQSAGAQAEVLFRQGRDLMAANKLEEACAAFAESQRLEPAITTLLNLAGCREKAGQLATAWGLFLEAERQTRSATDTNTKKLHDVAADRAKKLEPRVSKLSINVPQNVAVKGLEILRGSEAVTPAMWSHALPIDGGTHTITARAPGKKAWSTQITIAPERDVKTVDIVELAADDAVAMPASTTNPQPDDRSQPEEPDEPAPTTRRSRVVPIIIGGVGVGLLGGALGFEIMARSTYDDAKAEMTDQGRRDELFDSAVTKRYAAQGMAVAGAVGVGVAVWLFVRGGDKQDSTSSALHVVPSLSGISVVGRY